METQSLQKLDERESSLVALSIKFKDLKIKDVNDREGYKLVSEARKTLKSERVQISKDAEELREGAVKFQKAVIAREKELINIIEPAERALSIEERNYESGREQIKQEQERIEAQRIQDRVNALAKFGHAIDFYQAKSISDEKFAELITQAEIDFNHEQEKKVLDEKARKEEENRIAIERAEIERVRAEQERIAKEQQEREAKIKADQEKKEQAIRAEQERLEKERKAFEDQKAKEAAEKKRLEELEQAKKEAAERAKIEAEEKAKREEFERIERERIAKEEAERKEALRPDKEKILSLSKAIKTIAFPEVTQKDSVNLLEWTRSQLTKLSESLDQKTINL